MIGSESSAFASEASTGHHRYLQIHRPRTLTVPTAVSLPKPFTESETAPLLGHNPPIPRIIEEGDILEAGELEPGHVALYWEEVKILAKYTLPVVGSTLLEHTLNVAPAISIGHLSTTALAASTLGSMTAAVTAYSLLQGFAGTLDTLLPSSWTSDQPELVGLWAQRASLVMGVILFPIAVLWWNAEPIFLLLHQDPEVARLAALYLRWALLGLPAYAFNQVSRRFFQSQDLFSIPTRIILIAAPINALLNYLLVWGPDAIRLGFIGAPIASAISFNIMSVLSVVFGIYYAHRRSWHPFSRRIFTSLGILVTLGCAGIGLVCSEWWAWELVGRTCTIPPYFQVLTFAPYYHDRLSCCESARTSFSS